MKKLLSLILAVCMVISIAPAALATEDAEGGTDLAGVTVEYNIKSRMGTWCDGIVGNKYYKEDHKKFSDSTYASTSGFWEFSINSQGTDVVDNSKINWNKNGLFLKNAGWWAFKIYVPADGMYMPKVTYGHTTTVGNTLHVSVVKADSVSVINSTVINNNKLTISGSNAGIASPSTAPDKETWYEEPQVFDAKELTQGEYYVIYSCDNNSNWVLVSNLILDGTADDSTGTALMRPIVTANPNNITVGETTSALSAAVYDNNGVKVEDAVFTYESLNPEIATVEVDVVTGTFSGTAEIKATATKDAMTSDGTTEIKVTHPEAAPASITYDIASKMGKWNDEGKETPFSSFTYKSTNGFWEYAANSTGEDYVNKTNTNFVRNQGMHLTADTWWAIKIYVPESGEYMPVLNHGERNINYAGTINAYLAKADGAFDVDAAVSEGNRIAEVSYKNTTLVEGDDAYTTTNLENVKLDKGEYYLVYKATGGYIRVGNLTLRANDGTALMRPVVTKSANELDVEAKSTATLTTSEIVYTNKGEAKTATIAYSSANNCAEVSTTGTVTAKKGGVAQINITATVAEGNLTSTVAEYFTVTGPETVSFYAMSNEVDCPIAITATDIEGNKVDANTVANLERGADVTVTAPAVDGYIFVGWVRGAADSGRLVKTDATYSFTALTNTMLTAVYEPVADKAYYNWDGAFLGTTEPANPTMFGYHFKAWAENTEIAELTRYIAQYEQNDDDAKHNVTIASGSAINEPDGSYLYDAEVTLTSNSEVYWYRDGVQVAYGEEYTFNVWDDTTVSTSNSGSKGPMLYLDDKVGSYYMVEYDAAGDEIVEVGILFGDSANITVNSCNDKMNSQRNLSRGQFAADAGENTVARGYLIYEDRGEYKVIYSN